MGFFFNIVNDPTINIYIQVFFLYKFFKCIYFHFSQLDLRSGIARLHDNFIFNFLKKMSNCFPAGIPGWFSGLAPAFGPGHDPGVLGRSPASGSLHGACFSLCCVSASLSVSHE